MTIFFSFNRDNTIPLCTCYLYRTGKMQYRIAIEYQLKRKTKTYKSRIRVELAENFKAIECTIIDWKSL